MARSTKRKPAEVNQSESAQQPMAVPVQVEVSDVTPFYYINSAEVGHTLHEFSISAVRLPVKLSQDAMTEAVANRSITLPADVQLLLPPSMVRDLIRALSTQLEAYEERFGKIPEGARQQ
jgi:hypothetical protein